MRSPPSKTRTSHGAERPQFLRALLWDTDVPTLRGRIEEYVERRASKAVFKSYRSLLERAEEGTRRGWRSRRLLRYITKFYYYHQITKAHSGETMIDCLLEVWSVGSNRGGTPPGL